MVDLHIRDCCHPDVVALERVRYFPRQVLTKSDMDTDQDYFREKLRRHNRFLHGWGVVCGLEVVAAPTEDAPWRVKMTPGYALGPYGDEIYVPEPIYKDLAKCGPTAIADPCEPELLRADIPTVGGQLYIAIKYVECLASPVRAMSASCACDEVACEYSRIRDSLHIDCLTELPQSHQQAKLPLLCNLIKDKKLPTCPPCPTDPWVVLAKVTLPASRSQKIENNKDTIDNITVRRQLYSTAMLQEQLIKCCCEKEETQPQLNADLEIVQARTGTMEYGQIAITVTNHGPSIAHNVKVVDIFPPNIATVNFTPDASWTKKDKNRPLEAGLGSLAKNQSVTLSFTYRNVPEGSYSSIATVSSSTPDPKPDNNKHTLPFGSIE